MVHQLSEDSLTEIHPSLSEMAPVRAERFWAQIAPEKLQIEKTEFTRSLLISRGLFRWRKF
jgi:hypothetical protein